MNLSPKVPSAGGLVTLLGLTTIGTHPPAVAWALCFVLALIGAIWPQNSTDRSTVLLRLLDLFCRGHSATRNPGDKQQGDADQDRAQLRATNEPRRAHEPDRVVKLRRAPRSSRRPRTGPPERGGSDTG